MSELPASAGAGLDTDIVIVGAGAAGLAAAGVLRAEGFSTLVLEALDRVGGRAWTDHPAVLGGAQFDHGANWLHDATRNPLIPIAQAKGVAVGPDIPWDERLRIMPGAGDKAAFFDTWSRWGQAVEARATGPDVSLAEAGDALAGDPWLATIEAFEGAIIAAADADVLSLRDWRDNALDGENFIPAAGMGDLVTRCLAPEAGEVRLGVRVTGVAAMPGGVRLETSAGTVRAGAVLLTVSTGVLRAETIRFSPGLPQTTLAALNGLPMGLLSKVALPAADWLGLKPGASVFRRLAQRGGPFMSAVVRPDDAPYIMGFFGGRTAWDLSARPDAESLAFAREELLGMLGAEAADQGVVTDWGRHPCFLGAYAYATPGHAGARAVLGAPLWDGRLMLAGEAAATDGMAGTVAGAFNSGRHAAGQLCAYLRGQGFTRRAQSV